MNSETGSSTGHSRAQEPTQGALLELALSVCPGVGRVLQRRLTDAFGSAAATFEAAAADPRQVERVPGINARIAQTLGRGPDLEASRRLIDAASAAGARPLIPDDPEYPALLSQLRDRPPVLWIRGSLLPQDRRAVAIVGTRAARHYGHRMARRLAHDLAAAAVTVVSGGARGIDTEAHDAALNNNGRTLVVQGSGIDVVYPTENAELFERVAAQGAVLSDFPPGTPPEPGNFPSRNRIIAGLSWATIVVEAGIKSGALITAEHALAQGREVFAVPHPAEHAAGLGCNRLIKQGAGLVESAADVLEALRFISPQCTGFEPPRPATEPLELSNCERRVVDCLDVEPRHLDQLAQSCGMPSHEVLVLLYELELKGVVRALPGHLYQHRLEERWRQV